jgi:hypothetical protein
MDDRIGRVGAELQKTADDAKEIFGDLSASQLNWKPSEKSWSVAQCFDHLITAHGLFFPRFERFESGDRSQTFWEKHSPLSGYFGRFLIKSLDPKNRKKMKVTAKGRPSASEIDGDIIERFCDHQRQLIDHIGKLPASIDPSTFKVASPLLGFVTYTLGDALVFVPLHCQRHFDQAKRVMEMDGFADQ